MDLFKKVSKLKLSQNTEIEVFSFTVNSIITNRQVVSSIKNKKSHHKKEHRRSPAVVEEDPMVVGNELSNEDRKKRSELREQAKKILQKATLEKNES